MSDLSGVRVLVADDQMDVAQTMCKPLEVEGAALTFVPDGEAAMTLLEREHFGLLLVDMRMPPQEWGGLWLMSQLSDKGIRVPTIVLSGEGSNASNVKRALRLGAADWIDKSDAAADLVSRSLEVIAAAASSESPLVGLRELIHAGEGRRIEFKSTLRFDMETHQNNRLITAASIKTVAAFLNTDGGTLLIGVNDDGVVVGVEADQFDSIDKFRRHLCEVLKNALGVEAMRFVSEDVVRYGEGTVSVITCGRSTSPVLCRLKGKEPAFFVRIGPATHDLAGADRERWISTMAAGLQAEPELRRTNPAEGK